MNPVLEANLKEINREIGTLEMREKEIAERLRDLREAKQKLEALTPADPVPGIAVAQG